MRVLLVEANNMSKWVGTAIPYELHIPPIALMYLAAYVRQALPQIELRIVESSLLAADDESLARVLEEFKPDWVGVRSIAFFLEELQRVARVVKTHSEARLVAGGPIVKAYRKQLFEMVPELEMAVEGEGEEPLRQILAGDELASIAGLYFRLGEDVIHVPQRSEIASLDSIPVPAYDLVDLDCYRDQLSYAYNHRRQGVLVTSRGCVYHCSYCFSHWGKIRLRSAKNIFEEIRGLHDQQGVADFYIIDDIFNVNAQRAMELFDLINGAGLKIRLYFVNGLRADITSERFVDRALEAGAIWFTYAVESADEEIQRLVRKNLNLAKARHIIAYTQQQNVAVNISTMYGFPTETRAMAQRTLDFLGELPKPSLLPYHFCLRFFPGCDVNQQALEAGWDEKRLELTSRYSYNDLPMGTPTLSRQEMLDIQIEYHRRFGLKKPSAVDEAVRTLRGIGYSDTEILHMYSVLNRRIIRDIGELLTDGGA